MSFFLLRECGLEVAAAVVVDQTYAGEELQAAVGLGVRGGFDGGGGVACHTEALHHGAVVAA